MAAEGGKEEKRQQSSPTSARSIRGAYSGEDAARGPATIIKSLNGPY